MKLFLAVLAATLTVQGAAYAQTDESTRLIDVGSSALWVEVAGSSVYVSNPADGTIAVLDAATGEMTGTIESERGVSVLEVVGNRLYATVDGNALVFVYDLSTGQSAGTIDLGRPEITLSSTADQPYGQREYVTIATDALGLAYSEFEGSLYAVHSTVDRVVPIDLDSGRVAGEIPVGVTPLLMVVDDRRSTGYVTNYESNNVSVVDLPTLQVIKTLPTGFAPTQMAIDPDVNRLYVTHHASPHVAVIDMITLNVMDRIPVGGPTHALAMDREMGLLHVAHLPESGVTGAGQPGRVDFIDTFDNRVVGGFDLPQNPFTIAIDPQTRMLYAAVINEGSVVAVDLTQDQDYLAVAPDSGSPEGGGCLVATAAYGTELAPQVQALREVRDGALSSTAAGSAFVDGFNSIYYSFSPAVADMQRANPALREAVGLIIAPMVGTLQVMTLAESEAEVLGLGAAALMLNLGVYAGVPAAAVIAYRCSRRSAN